MPLEPSTDGEKIIQLDGKIDKLDSKIDTVCESIDRVVKALEQLEVGRVTDHETRISRIEKWQSEWSGAYKVMTIASLILGIIATVLIIATYTHPSIPVK